jgi:hypothetical protein
MGGSVMVFLKSRFIGVIFGFSLMFLSIDPIPTWAYDARVDLSKTAISQDEFKSFSEEAGLAISYIPTAPAESLGIFGFDAGVEVTGADIREDRSYWTKVTQDPPAFLVLPKLHVQKGLPFGFDIGAVYTKVPQSNISMIGGEVKWAFIGGNAVLPAVAIRGSYTKLLGVSGLNLQTIGADLSVSKGFAFVKPYAGAGIVRVQSKENVDLLNLKQENLNLPKGFIGVKISLLLINFVVQADFSKIPLYTARLNIGF